MEAELYQEIFDTLKNHRNRLTLPLNNDSPIQKVIWSSFDYMAGPELRFVWEADYLNKSSANLASSVTQEKSADPNILWDDKETVDGCTSSSDSSFSKNTGDTTTSTTRDRYEEIDNFHSDLMKLSSEQYVNKTALDKDMYSSRIGDVESNAHSTTLVNESGSLNSSLNPTTTQYSIGPHGGLGLVEIENRDDHCSNSNNMITSCVDSGIAGTISLDSNLSSYEAQEPKDEIMSKVEQQYCSKRSVVNRDLHQKNLQLAHEVVEFNQDIYSEIEDDALRNRPSTSRDTRRSILLDQIGTSFYSSCSTTDQTNLLECQIPQEQKAVAILSKEAELFSTELAGADSLANTLSDEAFVVKQVLAEQIGSIQLSSNPILHKFCIVPCRHLTFASYIFSTRSNDHNNSASSAVPLSALSVILPIERADWYLERQFAFQEIFSDMIARFKLIYLVEQLEDLICSLTREILSIFALFGTIEKWPLVKKDLREQRIQFSHLWEIGKMNESDRDFLCRSVTASLVCKGRCTVVGFNSREVVKLMITLSAFIHSEDRILCVRPYKTLFSPYLRLQAIKRSEIYQFYEQAAIAHWSSALIDIDRKSVVYTGLYHNKHRMQKRYAQFFQLAQIFRETMDSANELTPVITQLGQQFANWPLREMNIEMQTVRGEPSVYELLDQFPLLPLSRAARLSYIDHFKLRLENRAKALISYVRDHSAPSSGDKRSPLSSKWHLVTIRRNLGIQQDSAFGCVLAMADHLEPEFGEFIAQQMTHHP